MKDKDYLVGNNIRALLLEMNKSQQELADKCNLEKAYISRLISGKHKTVSLITATKIATFLGKADDMGAVFIYKKS